MLGDRCSPVANFRNNASSCCRPLVRVPRTRPSRERRRAPIADARPACLAASGEAVALDGRTGPRAVGASADARDRRPVQRHDSRVYTRHERATVAACPQRRRHAAAWRPDVCRVAGVPNAPTRVHANANPASIGGTQDQAEVAGVRPSAICHARLLSTTPNT
jgi:hypothetical protein